jgi:voltage-gated potassium channel
MGRKSAQGKGARHALYVQLDPLARRARGLSPLNKLLVVLIIAAEIAAVLETEPMISQGRETIFRAFELLFGVIFLIEYVARLWVAVESPAFATLKFPRLRYAATPAAIIDLLAIVPALLAVSAGGSLVLRLFRILRILRLAKLGRMSRAWRDIGAAVHSRRTELMLTLGLALVAMLVASTFLYWAEADAQPEKFGSIPRALWWSVVTLTTVGYGDVYPVTPLGKFFAAVLAISGIGLIALPTGILAAAFSDAMQRRREQDQAEGL